MTITTQPTVDVSISTDVVNLQSSSATVSFLFSSVPNGFSLSDVTAVGGTLSQLHLVQHLAGLGFTAIFTAAPFTDTSSAIVSVIPGSWTDTSGNPGQGGSTPLFTVDTISPSVTVAINTNDVNVANNVAAVTFTFTDPPQVFTLSDTTATGGTLSNLVQFDPTHYTATFTGNPAIDISNASVAVTPGSWQEVTGNAGGGATTGNFTVDTRTPGVTVGISTTDVNLAHNPATVSFTFTDAPTSFALADTSATGGTLSHLTAIDSTHYTATFTGASDTDISNASVSVTSGSWQEADGNIGTGGGTGNFTVDTVTPTASISMRFDHGPLNVIDSLGARLPTAPVFFTFSEAPASFTFQDIRATGGSVGDLKLILQNADETVYQGTFQAAANTDTSTASVSVVAGSWQDNNGNPGAGASTDDFPVDTVTPTLTLSGGGSFNVAHNSGTVVFDFSEAPTDQLPANQGILVFGGSLSPLTKVDATHYSATFTAFTGVNGFIGQGSITVLDQAWREENGNYGHGATVTFPVDTVTPTVAVAISNNTLNLAHNTATVTFAFSAKPDAFTLDDTSTTGGSLSGLTQVDATHYAATFTAAANTGISNASVSVIAGSWANVNPGAGGGTGNFTVDTAAPVLTAIANQTDEATSAAGAVATFSATATDIGDGSDPVVFKEGNNVVHSGDTFGIGNHTITASATDTAGNVTSETFAIHVLDPRAPITVSSSGQLAAAISAVDGFTDANATFTISLANDIALNNVPAIDLASGSHLTINGQGHALTDGSSNAGALVVQGAGTLTLSGNNTYSGGTDVEGGTLELAVAGAAGSGAITFGNGAVLAIDGTTLAANTVKGFAPGDTIDLSSITNSAGSHADMDYATNVLTITEGSSTYQLHFDPTQSFAGDYFHLAADHGGSGPGTLITEDPVACYLRGTLIATERGEVQVEQLAIGDNLTTASGALRPVKWIGTRSYGGRFIMGRKDILPICFKAGSLGDDLPRRDLLISPHHAMYFADEAVLIEAKDLVNGISIVQAEHVDSVEYFHIELDTHDVIIAEGALSESFIDDDSRAMFHNAQEYAALYPDNLAQRARYCAPRLNDGYEVDAIRRKLAARAGLLSDGQAAGGLRGHLDVVSPRLIEGWAQNIDHPEAPVCLDIHAGGRLIGQTLANRHREDLARAGLGSGRHSFSFRAPDGLTLSPGTVEVRRSLDGAALASSRATHIGRTERRRA